MTEIEKKALALWGQGVTAEVNLHNFSILGTAFLEMRERHEAFRQEVSRAIYVDVVAQVRHGVDAKFRTNSVHFIIPEPVDPLVEVFKEVDTGNGWDDEHDYADQIRKAIAKRGGKIVWEDAQ